MRSWMASTIRAWVRDVQPPHRQAANYYKDVAYDRDGQFKVTMAWSSKSNPKPCTIEITDRGERLLTISVSIGAASVVSTPSRTSQMCRASPSWRRTCKQGAAGVSPRTMPRIIAWAASCDRHSRWRAFPATLCASMSPRGSVRTDYMHDIRSSSAIGPTCCVHDVGR